MKKLFLLSFLIIFSACKQAEEKKEPIAKELTVAEKIAKAHGYENWDNVKTFAFTFGGTLEDPNSGRSWVWNPKTNDIKLTHMGKDNKNNKNNNKNIIISFIIVLVEIFVRIL